MVTSLTLVLAGLFFPPTETTLQGLWLKESADRQEFRFYYFHHEGGIGLYRYGRRALNNTHSFTYAVESEKLVLVFKKTGERHAVDYRFERKDDRRVLILDNDPREAGPTRYVQVVGPLGPTKVQSPEHHPFARMWTEKRTMKDGTVAFRIYQFQPPSAGQGKGWYHEGDYDDWKTESLRYRIVPGGLKLFFDEARRTENTKMERHEGDPRAIELMTDPRNFWHRGRFVDGGRSIMTIYGTPSMFVLP